VGESSFWYRPTRVVTDQRPLNGRCCCYIIHFCSTFDDNNRSVSWKRATQNHSLHDEHQHCFSFFSGKTTLTGSAKLTFRSITVKSDDSQFIPMGILQVFLQFTWDSRDIYSHSHNTSFHPHRNEKVNFIG